MEENENLLAEKIHGFERHEIDLTSIHQHCDPIALYELFFDLFEDWGVDLLLGGNIIRLEKGDCSLKVSLSLYRGDNALYYGYVTSDEVLRNDIDNEIANIISAEPAHFMVTRVTGERRYPNGGVTATFDWDYLKSKYSIYAPKDMLEPFSEGSFDPEVTRGELTKLTESDLAGVYARHFPKFIGESFDVDQI